jgi:hypothetical protein
VEGVDSGSQTFAKKNCYNGSYDWLSDAGKLQYNPKAKPFCNSLFRLSLRHNNIIDLILFPELFCLLL